MRAPLLEAGLTKDDVRRIARRLEIPIWSKPASACLASRVPYGTTIDPDVLARLKTDYESSFVRRLETVSAKTSALAQYNTFLGDPGDLVHREG